ncbi:hypothetical protein ACH37Y_06460 [Sphingomonas paucimobilis]|uniref:hypothetical protein n=1 Tax=Sphingomonas paucimobilis TaxID=13689 RepID=UPI0037ABE959
MNQSQRARIVFMGLVALDEAAERSRAARGPVDTCLSDRVVLATLYSVAGRGRSSFYGFWRELRRPIGPLTGDATMRGNMLHTHFCGICQALGVRQTIAFTSALGEARREPMLGFRDPEPFPADEARARFAELLRETMNDQRDADRERRAGRECGLRG